ncbi:MAG TPA: hypothetical protein VJ815_02250 [Acidimicrobiia bacterium]|nr:hypothetical protein [Acidimicrobiia bacterium]
MRLEDRIRNELHDTAERLALDPGEYRRAVEAAQRRRQQRILGALSGMVVVAGLVVIVLALRPVDEMVVSPSSTTAPATTAPSPTTTALPVVTAGAAVVVAGPDGISWTELGGDGKSGILESDPYYEAISWVASDGEGGLVFTHEVTPLSWDQGTLLWLPAGAAAPRPVAAPPTQGQITPIGVDSGRVYYRLDSQGMSEIIGVDLDGQNQEVLIPAAPDVRAAALDGPVLAVVQGFDCAQISLFMTVDGHQMPGGFSDCYPGSISDVSLSGDSIYVLEDGSDGHILRHLSTAGEDRGASPVDGWQIEALDPSTVAIGGTSITVGDFSGDAFIPRIEIEGSNTFALVPSVNVHPNASLGAGLGELPCTPLDLPALATQGLPEPVEAKRQLIFELASGCEMGKLAEVVLEDGAAFTFGGEEDPLRTWIASARLGFDVMSMTVRILNADPALDGAGVYAWPAVHATNSEEHWQALSGILSAAEFEQFYQFRESGYLGLRLGIDPDGRLVYLIAGD